MICEGLFTSWKESLQLLRLSNLKLLLLVSLNTARRGLGMFSRYCIPLIILLVIINAFQPLTLALSVVSWCFQVALVFLYFLIARPSMETKEGSYVFTLFPLFLNYLAAISLLTICGCLLIGSLVFLLHFFTAVHYSFLIMSINVAASIIGFVLAGIITFLPFFVLDGGNSISVIKSTVRAYKLFVYHVPIVILVPLFLSLSVIPNFFINYSPWYVSSPLIIMREVLYFFGICFAATLYLKIKHSHYTLFFPS